MYVDKDSVIVNGVSMGQYISSAKFGWHKVWSSDTGRNMSYEMQGTVGGIFPKITLNFHKLKQSEIEIIAPILDSQNQTVIYKNTNGITKTMTTYSGDWEQIFKGIGIGEEFSCPLISVSKR